MNPNEIRGYIFLGYGLICFCTLYLSGYHSDMFLGLFVLFLLWGMVFSARAMVKKKQSNLMLRHRR